MKMYKNYLEKHDILQLVTNPFIILLKPKELEQLSQH
jgi:hypothetical protein